MKKKFRYKVAKTLEMPQDVVMNVSKITIVGNHQLYLENNKGILEYSDTLMRLNLGQKQLKISGSTLEIDEIDSDTIRISGDISMIEFIESLK